jgi:peptide/nickel transport system substrate-binding protein
MHDKSERRRWVGLTWVAVLATVLAGCGTPQPEGATPEAPPATAGPGELSTIVMVIPEDPPSFNGLVTDAGYDSLVMELVLLSVTDIDPQGNIFPELAASLPTVENGGVVLDEASGAMDVTWTLRNDVSWADGEPVTADDVIFTWEAINAPEGGIWVQGSDYVDSVEKTDEFTFVVHYTSVYTGYLTQFGGDQVVIWPHHYCDASQGFVAWDCNRQPLSDGPYILEEWEEGDHLTFVRNPMFYQAGKPLIDRIIIRIVPEAAVRQTMMARGDADVDVWVTEAGIEELSSAPDVAVSMAPSPRWVFRLFPNLAARGTIDAAATPHPILSDVRVRQAMRMAIDVETISQTVFRGYGQPIWTEFFRPPYICTITRPAYDPEGAQAMLESAGWVDTNDDAVRECQGCLNAPEGYRMSMEFATYGEYGPELELAQQLIGEMLGRIGFELQLRVLQGPVMWADQASGGTEQNGQFDLDMYDDGYPGVDPTEHLYFYYYSASAVPDAGFNVGRWISPEFDALLDEAYTLDEARRQEVFCQIAQLLDEQLPQILLFSAVNADAHSTRLEGVQSTVNDMVTWNVADWRLTQ